MWYIERVNFIYSYFEIPSSPPSIPAQYVKVIELLSPVRGPFSDCCSPLHRKVSISTCFQLMTLRPKGKYWVANVWRPMYYIPTPEGSGLPTAYRKLYDKKLFILCKRFQMCALFSPSWVLMCMVWTPVFRNTCADIGQKWQGDFGVMYLWIA